MGDGSDDCGGEIVVVGTPLIHSQQGVIGVVVAVSCQQHDDVVGVLPVQDDRVHLADDHVIHKDLPNAWRALGEPHGVSQAAPAIPQRLVFGGHAPSDQLLVDVAVILDDLHQPRQVQAGVLGDHLQPLVRAVHDVGVVDEHVDPLLFGRGELCQEALGVLDQWGDAVHRQGHQRRRAGEIQLQLWVVVEVALELIFTGLAFSHERTRRNEVHAGADLGGALAAQEEPAHLLRLAVLRGKGPHGGRVVGLWGVAEGAGGQAELNAVLALQSPEGDGVGEDGMASSHLEMLNLIPVAGATQKSRRARGFLALAGWWRIVKVDVDVVAEGWRGGFVGLVDIVEIDDDGRGSQRGQLGEADGLRQILLKVVPGRLGVRVLRSRRRGMRENKLGLFWSGNGRGRGAIDGIKDEPLLSGHGHEGGKCGVEALEQLVSDSDLKIFRRQCLRASGDEKLDARLRKGLDRVPLQRRQQRADAVIRSSEPKAEGVGIITIKVDPEQLKQLVERHLGSRKFQLVNPIRTI